MNTFKPELLAPAGNPEKLRVAVLYGADAVYLSGQRFGLRAASENFTDSELALAVAFAHSKGVKVYVVLNAYLHDEDLEGLSEYCQYLESINVDALIVSDLGVIQIAKKSCSVPVHLSTQASCLNVYSAKVWRDLGAERIIVGRELSIEETSEIKKQLGMEVEMFIHGAMCMAYSGQCTISNFTAGRDSNRGGCVQSCRFEYKFHPKAGPKSLSIVDTEKVLAKSNFMSSKDMNGLRLLPTFCENKIDSLKIEGRMKSVFYLATMCRVYSEGLNLLTKEGSLSAEFLNKSAVELGAVPHRDYCEASFESPAGIDSIFSAGEATRNYASHDYCGIILDQSEGHVAIRLNRPVKKGSLVECLPFAGAVVSVNTEELYSLSGERIDEARQDSVICVPKASFSIETKPYMVVRNISPL